MTTVTSHFPLPGGPFVLFPLSSVLAYVLCPLHSAAEQVMPVVKNDHVKCRERWGGLLLSSFPLVFLSSDLGAEEEDLVPSEHAAAHP